MNIEKLSQNHSIINRTAIFSLVFTSVLLSFLFIASFDDSSPFSSSISNLKSKKVFTETESEDTFQFTVKRKGYDPLIYFQSDYNDTLISYKILSNYDGVLEPYSTMTLTPKSNSSKLTNYYHYTICLTDDSTDCLVSKGAYYPDDPSKTTFFVPKCVAHDSYTITVTEYNSLTNSQISSSSIGKLLCIYVRREIQSLTTDDFDAVMDAMYTLWSTTEEDGQISYGKNFHNSTYFVKAHDFNAGLRDSDHIHEGLGFMTQHAKLTNWFDQSLRAVDASVSLPYWDYTLEVEQGKSIVDSIMFTNRSFGTLTLPHDLTWGFTYRDDEINSGRISDGRWKDALSDPADTTSLSSPFGFIRGQWNTNPSPYITRYATSETMLPSCRSFKSFLESSIEMTDFLYSIELSPHASTHGAIGAVFGCDLLDELREAGLIEDEDSQISLCKQWPFIIKALYRNYYLEPSPNCSILDSTNMEDETSIQCGYICDPNNYNNMTIFLKSQIRNYVPKLTDSQLTQWRDFFCTGNAHRLFSGDHLEAASPADPSFWSIHPTLDRLLHAKFIAGGFPDSIWPRNMSEAESLDMFVCNKAECYEDGVYATHNECCQGHYAEDQMFDFVNADRSSNIGQSNREILSALDASSISYNVDYIYDEFEFSHCSSSSSSSSSASSSTTDIKALLVSWMEE